MTSFSFNSVVVYWLFSKNLVRESNLFSCFVLHDLLDVLYAIVVLIGFKSLLIFSELAVYIPGILLNNWNIFMLSILKICFLYFMIVNIKQKFSTFLLNVFSLTKYFFKLIYICTNQANCLFITATVSHIILKRHRF